VPIFLLAIPLSGQRVWCRLRSVGPGVAIAVVKSSHPSQDAPRSLYISSGVGQRASKRAQRGIRRALLWLATIDHPQTSLGSAAIATSTTTIRVPVDYPTINHRERLRDHAQKIAPTPFRDFPPKKIFRLWRPNAPCTRAPSAIHSSGVSALEGAACCNSES
jgi:hypothetical protein